MFKTIRMHFSLVLLITITCLSQISAAQTIPSKIGIVVMHGKGGSPNGYVLNLASSLGAKGYLVTNLEVPWSKQREYQVSVSVAENEIESAFDALRNKGAKKLFVIGHSQGGVFALFLGSKHIFDGIVAVAPGGNVSNLIFQEKLGTSVELAQKLVADGKGNEKTRFYDYESSKGLMPVITTPAIYLTWFDPNGAMNQTIAVKAMNPKIPVLYIVPTGDYPGLRKVKDSMFSALPSNPLSKLYEPNSNHIEAPSASYDEIVRWINEVDIKSSSSTR